jgi:hypothetical protein
VHGAVEPRNLYDLVIAHVLLLDEHSAPSSRSMVQNILEIDHYSCLQSRVKLTQEIWKNSVHKLAYDGQNTLRVHEVVLPFHIAIILHIVVIKHGLIERLHGFKARAGQHTTCFYFRRETNSTFGRCTILGRDGASRETLNFLEGISEYGYRFVGGKRFVLLSFFVENDSCLFL